MRKFITVVSILIAVVTQGQEINVYSGSVKRHENFKSQFVAPRNVDVWLPNGYSKNEKYAVLYMHDGQMLFDPSKTWNKQEWQADEVAAAMIDQDATQKFIIVGIASLSKSRHADYFPQKPFESLPEKQQDSLYEVKLDGGTPLFQGKVNSDNYLKFIVTELKPFIDKTYSVKTDMANTFIAGSSMGGLISLYAICEYPEIFGGAACISTHWPGVFETENNPIPNAFFAYMDKSLPSPKNHKIYFDHGTETLDASYRPFQKKADEVMKKKGYTSANWITKEFEGLDHSEEAWAARLDQPIFFLLGK